MIDTMKREDAYVGQRVRLSTGDAVNEAYRGATATIVSLDVAYERFEIMVDNDPRPESGSKHCSPEILTPLVLFVTGLSQ